MRRSGLSTACLAVVMAWSCRDGAPRRPARTANDGPIAGRAAVEDLVLGQSEGDSGATFSGIVAVHVDGRGNIYVLDNGDRAIQVFAPDGRHLRAIGGNGSGPGEFRDPAGFSVLGDSLLVTYDRILQRLTWFGMDGRLVTTRSVKLPMMQYGLVTYVAALDRGALVFGVTMGYHTEPRPGRDGTGTLLRVSADGSVIDTILAFDGPRMIAVRAQWRYPLLFPTPFAPGPHWDIGPDARIAFGYGDRNDIAVLDGAGRQVQRLQWDMPPSSVTGADVRDFRASFPWGDGVKGLDPATRDAAKRVLDTLAMPVAWPAFDAIRFDDRGRLWVRRAAGDRIPISEWDVFANGTQRLGTVRLPRRLSVRQISRDAIYGVTTDEDGVPRVRRFRLVDPTRERSRVDSAGPRASGHQPGRTTGRE